VRSREERPNIGAELLVLRHGCELGLASLSSELADLASVGQQPPASLAPGGEAGLPVGASASETQQEVCRRWAMRVASWLKLWGVRVKVLLEALDRMERGGHSPGQILAAVRPRAAGGVPGARRGRLPLFGRPRGQVAGGQRGVRDSCAGGRGEVGRVPLARIAAQDRRTPPPRSQPPAT